ncbi:hypothetical protein HJC23_005896 [Cyclotella cryptica]|uniref:RING-type domain-containing protein n=1 Tax=Cyclotella cryptica TaxID=29204 RepID=A0ABD3QZF4_9STRA|eukprot:CCRYP_000423-RA/>CCRYP_000423-RA protein AED:0.13 eAED:0.13 QI:0/-1/0/1/-1/1/1/0/219
MGTRSQTSLDSISKSSTEEGLGDISAASEDAVTLTSLDENTSHVECPICYEIPSPEDVTIVCGCKHKFCFGCIDNWAQIKNSCPLCNYIFTAVIRGSSPHGGSKTYIGIKRKRVYMSNVEERLAAVRARIESNDHRQAELQRQIASITQQRDQLRLEADHIRLRIELQRLRMETMQMQTTHFMLQRAEIENLIARIRSEVSQIDDYIQSRRRNDLEDQE